MKDNTRKALRLFVEQAHTLSSRGLPKFITEQGEKLGIQITMKKNAVTIERVTPDDDAIAAFVLTFRFFIQDNETTSLRNLAQLADSDARLSEEWKREFTRVRSELNQYLDSPTQPMRTVINDVTVSRRNIMNVFIYGFLAHANEQHRRDYETWKDNPVMFEVLQNEFNGILMSVYRSIVFIADLCEQELSK